MKRLPNPRSFHATRACYCLHCFAPSSLVPRSLLHATSACRLPRGPAYRDCVARVQHGVPVAMGAGTAFWVPVNIVNFALVPPSQRVLYANAAGLLWNAYLSSTNTAASAAPGAAPTAAPR